MLSLYYLLLNFLLNHYQNGGFINSRSLSRSGLILKFNLPARWKCQLLTARILPYKQWRVDATLISKTTVEHGIVPRQILSYAEI